MKKPASGGRKATGAGASDKTAAPPANAPAKKARIHPVIIYPFKQPIDYSDLEALYTLIAELDAKKETYKRPLTVMDRKTLGSMDGNKTFHDFRQNTVGKHSDILDAWCVDTCQMWYTGMGSAFEKGAEDDVY